jgi:TonB family protein
MSTKRRLLSIGGVVALSLVMQASPHAQATSTEAALLQRVAAQPAEISNYLELAKIYAATRRFDDAEQMLTRALAAVRQARIAPIPPQGVMTGNLGPSPTVGSRMLLPVAAVAPLRVGGDIKEPRKIKDVKPVYPEAAQASKVSGIVILEAIIDQQGMVRDVKVLRSVALLDQAAIDAVMQWQFTQTLLNGVPVEVVMTVTVNFSLS